MRVFDNLKYLGLIVKTILTFSTSTVFDFEASSAPIFTYPIPAVVSPDRCLAEDAAN